MSAAPLVSGRHPKPFTEADIHRRDHDVCFEPSSRRTTRSGGVHTERALAALENGQPAQPVEQIKQTAVVGGDVVALDALRALRNVGQEMADLTRPARVGNLNKPHPLDEPSGPPLMSPHLFSTLI